MCNVVVYRLRLNHLYVGYRVEATKTNGKRVYFDVSNELLEPFLKLFDRENIAKGGVIEGRDVGGVFVTDNEKDVYEVETRSKGKMLVNRHFRCDISGMCDEERYVHLKSYITGSRLNLSDVKYGSFGDVPKVYSLLEKAANGVECNILLLKDSLHLSEKRVLKLGVVFADLKEELSFIHNLLYLLNRKVWMPDVEVIDDKILETPSLRKKHKIPYTEDKGVFIRDALSRFGIKDSGYLILRNAWIAGSAGFGGILSCGDIRPEEEYDERNPMEYHCFICSIPIPEEGSKDDGSEPRYRVKWADPVKERVSSKVFLSVSRCNELVSSFVCKTFEGDLCSAFTKMLHMGFNANEMAGRFGFTKSVYEDWLTTATPKDIIKAQTSMRLGKVKISTERYRVLLNELIDYVMVGESLSNSIMELFAIGFTADELVNYFNFNKSDVERCLDSD